MMGLNSQSKKEACSVCSKNILIGHPSIACSSCDRIYHSKCSKNTKPLFNKLAILAFQNLFNYQICLETLKTLKSRTPQSLFQLYVVSTRNNQLYLRARADETPYIKSRVNIWNNCIKLIARSETLTTIKISKFKKDLKKTLLKIQNAFNSVEWYPDLNFTLR